MADLLDCSYQMTICETDRRGVWVFGVMLARKELDASSRWERFRDSSLSTSSDCTLDNDNRSTILLDLRNAAAQ